MCHMQTHPYPVADANHGNGIVPGIPMATAAPLRSGPLPAAEVNHSSSAKANPNVVTAAALCGTRPIGIGIQDERELKREKRKQSNRESARRSRLRKQAEMGELVRKVDSLMAENMALRSEISKLVEDSEKIRVENAALTEKLKNVQGQTGKTVSDRTNEQEDLLSKVNNSSVPNGNHEQGGDDK
uniref:BZIP domain-containing protein n=1 Tax=Opuntia streptacantha TaxID=393608 RepID=A0A7C9AQP4_OPUST